MEVKQRIIAQKLQELYSVIGIPAGILSKTTSNHQFFPEPIVKETNDYQTENVYRLLKEYQVPIQTPLITIITDSVLVCVLQMDEDLTVVLGPVALHEMNSHEHLEYMNRNYSASLAAYHMKLVYGAPRVDVHYFCNIVLHMTHFLCDRVLSIKDILFSKEFSNQSFSDASNMIKRSHVSMEQLSVGNEICEMIKNGNVKKLKDKLASIQFSSYYYFQENGVYFLRFAFIYNSAILCHYATQGGLSDSVAKQVLAEYLNKFQFISGPEYYWELLPRFAIELCRKVHVVKLEKYESDIINVSLKYIKDNVYEPIQIEDLEKQTHATGKTITRHFKRYLDTTPAHFIANAKLEEAAYLLEKTDLKIVEITNLLSFSSQTHLNRNFLKKYHCTPSQYRSLHKK